MSRKDKDEYRDDLDGLFSLAESVDAEVKRLKFYRGAYAVLASITISVGAVLVLGGFGSSLANSDQYSNSIFVVAGSAVLLSGAFLMYRYARNTKQLHSETRILNEILLSIHGLMDSTDVSLRPLELQTYQMRLRRLSFEIDDRLK